MTKLLDCASRTLQKSGALLLVRKSLRFVVDRLSMTPARRALKARLVAAENMDEYLDTVYSFRYRNISVAPSQIRSEITALLDLLAEASPNVVVEIGTGLGGTTLLLARIAAQNATLVTIDLPIGPSRQGLLDSGSKGHQRIWAIRADSHDPSTLSRVQSIIGQQQVDVLFIDGDHSYEGVEADFRLYSPLVQSNGWIVFHDIVSGPSEFVGGVPDFWSELKRGGRETREFIENRGQRGLGIGLIRGGFA